MCSLAGRELDRIRKRPLKQVEAKRQPALVWLLDAVDHTEDLFCLMNTSEHVCVQKIMNLLGVPLPEGKLKDVKRLLNCCYFRAQVRPLQQCVCT